MDGFFTTPFLSQFPDNLKSSFFSESSSYYDLFKSIKAGYFITGVEEEAFITLLDELKETEPELFNQLLSLESSGKIKASEVSDQIIDVLSDIKLRKSVLGQISSGYAQNTNSVFHDNIEDSQKKQAIIKSGSKPLIDHNDLHSGRVSFLFEEKSFPQNQKDQFNWARFLKDYNYPLNRIRILDPYLYANLKDIDLNNMLKSLLRYSKSEYLSIEIISNLGAVKRKIDETEEDVVQKVTAELKIPPKFADNLTLYTQKGSASSVFHKRAIWTDFWVLLAERGLDFTKLATGQGTVKRENTLYLTGRYSSKNSLWHQIDENWQTYLEKSKQINY